MKSAIEGLEPELVWKYFYELSQIPRASYKEQAACEWVKKEAESFGHEVLQDAEGNILVRVAATAGLEDRPSVCLQGHLDMVCEKNRDCAHDFDKDPIKILRDGDWMFADGTTLGADNGIGVAAGLALMADKSIEHGPVELLFTVNEESGMTGVKALDGSMIRSRILLNLDSEEDGIFYIGCAGGRDTNVSWKADLEAVPAGTTSYQVTVRGLRGGHSGCDIHEGRANALQILNRALWAIDAVTDMRVSAVQAGNKRNAIAREGEATLHFAAGDLEKVKAAVAAAEKDFQLEFKGIEPKLAVAIAPIDAPADAKVLSKKDQKNLLFALHTIPHGVQAMCAAVPGLVETSSNLAIVELAGDTVTITTNQRSNIDSAKFYVSDKIKAIADQIGADCEQTAGYTGWPPNPDSKVLATAKAVWTKTFEKEPEVKAIHAGLECAIIGGKVPGMDMISFGPTLMGVHSPDEKLQISAVPRFWKFTCALLKEIA